MSEAFTPEPGEIRFSGAADLTEAAPEAALVHESTEFESQAGMNVESRLLDVQTQIEAIKEQHNITETGGNSFYDVTGNLLGVARSFLRYWKEDGEQEDLEQVEQSLHLLEGYMSALSANPDVLTAELTVRDGAFPDLRQEGPIAHYVEGLQAKLAEDKTT